MKKKQQIGFDSTKPMPGVDEQAREIMNRMPETERALQDLFRQGLVESRKNPITGMREYRITEQGICEAAKNAGGETP